MEKMEKLNSQMFLRCTSGDRLRVKELSAKLLVSESSIARVAFKKGLEIVAERGIPLDSCGIQSAREETRR